jgi:hypothetical protein
MPITVVGAGRSGQADPLNLKRTIEPQRSQRISNVTQYRRTVQNALFSGYSDFQLIAAGGQDGAKGKAGNIW